MILKCGIEISSAKHDLTGCINGEWLCGTWLMVKFQSSYLQAGTVNHKILMKFARTRNPFCLYLMEKNNWWGGAIAQYLSRSDW